MRAPGGHPGWRNVREFFRLPLIGGSSATLLLGLATAHTPLGPDHLGLLLLVAVLFHIQAALGNDLVDLHIDRADPMRALSPLVRGIVAQGVARAVGAAALGGLFVGIMFASGDAVGRSAALGVAVAGVGAYNLWGKTGGLPLLTDLAQGVGWAGLAAYAAVVSGGVSWLTLLVGLELVGYTMLVTGVHGSLRDLAVDSAQGGLTTAMVLGARFQADDVTLPRRLHMYVDALHALLVGLCLATAVIGPSTRWDAVVLSLAGAALAVAAWAFARRALRTGIDEATRLRIGSANMLIAFASICALAGTGGRPLLSAAALGVFVLPLTVNPHIRAAFTAPLRMSRPPREDSRLGPAALDINPTSPDPLR
ncbi:UbiA family prenyltransferase [Streptomyces xylophagus]|uniref:UbiA family prenyltransferase n=1 Tax=Streptomyces xylophagus TaxID=285514 RepID=UPI0005B786F3|nr:UbiA family prenyltransferase [Streptomyces xylophagus]